MLIKIITLVIFLLTASLAFSQPSDQYKQDSISLKNVRISFIELESKPAFNENVRLPFNRIVVSDVRFDTTLIGVYYTYSNVIIPVINNYKLNLKGGLKNALERNLNEYFKEEYSDKNELVIFVKKFFFGRKDTLVRNEWITKDIVEAKIQFDVLIKSSDRYFPVFKVDTTFSSTISTTKTDLADDIKEELITPIMEYVQKRISSIDPFGISKKKSFSDTLIHDYYFKKRFDLPILQASNYKKGVYRNFKEFKQNSPSILEFSTQKEKFKTISLKDEKGDEININRIFGFSSGNTFWVPIGNTWSPLIKVGNNFEFFYHLNKSLKLLLPLDMDRESYNY